jgi:predicted anti-sigma-YlaC factor YlaD
MNHQPFEEWLLADEPPVGEQAIELDEHLLDCPRCRQLGTNWADVHQLFITSEQIAPAPGFTTRWQARLQEQQELARKQRNHRRPWLLFLLNFGIAGILLVLLGFQLWQNFHSTAQLLLVKAFLLSLVLTAADIGQDILSALIQVAVRFPIVQWAFLLGMSGFLGMLWITVGRQLVSIRRIPL